MRISHVITRLIVGGAQENTIASALGLAARPGCEVELVSGPSEGPEGTLEYLLPRSGRVRHRVVSSLVRPIHPWKDLMALKELADIFRNTRPDVVHTHSGKAGVLGRAAARLQKVPLIVHTIHGPSFGNFQGALANLAFRTAENVAAACTHHFAAVSQAMIDQYLAAGIGVPGQYTRILSGFDLSPFLEAKSDSKLRSELGLTAEDFVVGKLARLAPLKGYEDLIRAAPALLEKVPNAKFLIVGDGPSRGLIQGEIARLGLERAFVFTGLIPPSDVGRHLAQMDVLVHLSRREGLPRALPQAMAVGKPVVAFDVDGAREVCIDGRTGFLLRVGDTVGLTARLAELAGDQALCRQFGEEGRRLVERQFSVETMVDQLHELYRGLLGRPRGTGVLSC